MSRANSSTTTPVASADASARYLAALRRSLRTSSRRTIGPSRAHRDAGFTLIELLVASLLIPVVIGGIAVALISVLSLQPATQSRVSDAADAQTVSTYFDRDVQSSAYITTNATPSTPSACGTGTPLLSLYWSSTSGSTQTETVVSYSKVTIGTSTSLVREYCAAGASSTPSLLTYISHDIPASQPSPTIHISGTGAGNPATNWIPVAGVSGVCQPNCVTGVTFAIDEPDSNYTYSLTSVPKASSALGSLSGVTPPTTTCGFATPGTGTYASTLCFVDFSSYNYASTSGVCQKIVAGIVNTPYQLSFCLKSVVTPSNYSGPACLGSGPSLPAAVVPCPIPTYFDPPASEAFLGNNGFYTGVPGDPALYENAEGTSASITITNIQLTDANGNPASGWYLVTGDAESTDSGESITWSSDQLLTLLPNSPTSDYGNACANPTPGSGLTGVGTSTVECAANQDSDKTGTVMLQAAQPTKLTVNMVGTGLQAVFIGVRL